MINKKKYLVILISLGLITALLLASLLDIYKNRESYKHDLIRFHVLANSDSPFDQALKIKVRDKVMGEMNKRFDMADIDEARDIIKRNINDIEEIAQEEIREMGYNYPVEVMLKEHQFPTKNYGSITLPAGTYEALRVVIGEGNGENWWCVLFPPLCFIDINNGLTDQKTKEELRGVLSEDEFHMINSAAQNGELPIKLKFKIVEVLENSKWKLGKLVGLNDK